MSVTNDIRAIPAPQALAVADGLHLTPLNIDLLRKVVMWATQDYMKRDEHFGGYTIPDWAEEFDVAEWGTWDQGNWGQVKAQLISNGDVTEGELEMCGSSFCIAGNVCAQIGYALLPEAGESQSDLREFISWADFSVKWGASYAAPKRFNRLDDKGKPLYTVDMDHARSISSVAQDALGLSETEAGWLFDGSNTIGHVIDWSMRFAAIRGQNLNLPDECLKMAKVDPMLASYYEMRFDPFAGGSSLMEALWTEREPVSLAGARHRIEAAFGAGEISEPVYQAAMERLAD